MVSNSITWSLFLSHCQEEINFVSCSVVLLVSFPFSCCPYSCHIQFLHESQLLWVSEEKKQWWDLLTRKHYSLYGLVSEALSSDPILIDLWGFVALLSAVLLKHGCVFCDSPISWVLAVLNQTTMLLYLCYYLFNRKLLYTRKPWFQILAEFGPRWPKKQPAFSCGFFFVSNNFSCGVETGNNPHCNI